MNDRDTGDTSVSELLSTLRDELDATAELPVDPQASPWLGEASAVARDAAEAAREGADDALLAERVDHVRRLLGEAGETGNEAADARVDNAADLADVVAERLRETDE